MGVYSSICVHADTTFQPSLYVNDTGVHAAGIPPIYIAYFAEQEPATADILPLCYCEDGCRKLKLMEKNSNVTIAKYNGRRVPHTIVSWNITAFPNIAKAMAGDYVCENDYVMAIDPYQLNVVGK